MARLGRARPHRPLITQAVQPASGDISGTCALSFAGTNTLTGSGALAGVATNTFAAGSSVLTGSGSLAGSSANVFGAGSSVLLGSGALAGVAANTFGAGSSTLTGDGLLAGVAAALFGAGSSTLAGAGTLAGASANVFGAGSSALTGAGSLVGVAAGTFGAGSTSLTGSGVLAGVCVNTFAAGSSTLTASGALAGSSANVFGAGSSTLTGGGSLAGVSAIAFTGALTASGSIAGACSITFGASAPLTGSGLLSGAVAIALAGSGSLNGAGVLNAANPLRDADHVWRLEDVNGTDDIGGTTLTFSGPGGTNSWPAAKHNNGWSNNTSSTRRAYNLDIASAGQIATPETAGFSLSIWSRSVSSGLISPHAPVAMLGATNAGNLSDQDWGWALVREYQDSSGGSPRVSFYTQSSGGTVDVLRINTTLADNLWHHTVITRGPGANAPFALYVDGVKVSGTSTGAKTPATFPFAIGAPFWSYGGITTTSIRGGLDEAVYWNRVLTDAEAAALYGSGVGLFDQPTDLGIVFGVSGTLTEAVLFALGPFRPSRIVNWQPGAIEAATFQPGSTAIKSFQPGLDGASNE